MIDETKLRGVLSQEREMEIAQFFVDNYAIELRNNDFKSICEDFIKHSSDHYYQLYEIYAFLLLNFNINMTRYLRAGDTLDFRRNMYGNEDIEIDCPVIYRNNFYFGSIGRVYLTENVKKIETFGIKYDDDLELYITDKLEKLETYGMVKLYGEDSLILKAEGAIPHDLNVSTQNDYHKIIYEAIKRGKSVN